MFLGGLITGLVCLVGSFLAGSYFGNPDAGLFIGAALAVTSSGVGAYLETRQYR